MSAAGAGGLAGPWGLSVQVYVFTGSGVSERVVGFTTNALSPLGPVLPVGLVVDEAWSSSAARFAAADRPTKGSPGS